MAKARPEPWGAAQLIGYYTTRRSLGASKAPMRAQVVACLMCALGICLKSSAAAGQTALSGESIRISRATGPITIDGDLSDAGWRGAKVVETWYEVNPGDNLEPK